MGEVLDAKDKQSRKPSLPEFEMGEDGNMKVLMTPEGKGRLSTLFGGSSEVFVNGMLYHCINVSGRSEDNVNDKTYAVGIVAEIAPKDAIEGMLATQMAAIHIATMRHSRMMAGSETIQQLELHERVLNKLARTFTTQMEALRKHRNGGKQTVTVQHVNVQDGGEAIVGDVTHGAGGRDEK